MKTVKHAHTVYKLITVKKKKKKKKVILENTNVLGNLGMDTYLILNLFVSYFIVWKPKKES